MKRVLIVGAAGWKNAGDDLIALKLGDWAGDGGVSVRYLGGTSINSVGPGSAMSGGMKARVRIVLEIARADVVIIGGGGLFDDRYPTFYRVFTRIAKLARTLRKTHGFVGLGVGPVRTAAARQAYREAAAHADFVWVRDQPSRDHLVDVGVDPRRVENHGDVVAWRPHSPEPSVAKEFDLTINLRGWGHVEGGGADLTAPVAEAICDYLDINPGVRVALVSMSRTAGEDDIDSMLALRPYAKRVVDSADPREVERVIAASERVLSMRLHGCLIAVANNIPAVGIAYDPKLLHQGEAIGFNTIPMDAADTATISRILGELPVEPTYNAPARPKPPWH